MTLPGLLRGAALLRPEKPVLIDSANAASLAARPARRIDARGLEAETTLLARKLAALGLKPGEHVIIQLPNTVEATIGILGVLAAGGIPAVTPVFTPQEELQAQARLIDAAGILTMSRFAGTPLAERARTLAANCESIRFAAAFGESAPAGVAALDGWTSIEFLGSLATPAAAGTDRALVTFDRAGDEIRAFARSHAQLVVDGSAAAALGQISAETRVLATVPPASAAGVTLGIVAPLLAGATTHLNALFDDCGFAEQLGDGRNTVIILPGAAEEAFHAHCSQRKLRAETLIFVQRPAAGSATLAGLAHRLSAERTVDSIALGEATGWLAPRGRSIASSQPMQMIAGMFEAGTIPLLLAADGRRLVASGPLAPQQIGSSDPHVDTGFLASLIAVSDKATAKAARQASAA